MASTHPGCTTLLDLPDELLSSCLPSSDFPNDHLSTLRPCMSACKKLMRVMLKGSRSGTLGLQLRIRQIEDIPVRRATLQLMTKAFPELHKLHIHSSGVSLHDDLAALLTAPEKPDAGCLKGITHLCLGPCSWQDASLFLAHPVSLSVASAFANQKELELSSISFSEQHQQQLTGQTAQPARLEHLRHLRLHECRLCNSAAAFQQQLQQLPSLRQLSLVDCVFVQEQAYAAAVADSCSAKLTHMEWSRLSHESRLSVLLSRPYAQLQALLIPDTKVDDSAMELLMRHTPSIKKLHVGSFELEQDFSHRQCSWEMVVIHHCRMDVTSFACMPLSHTTNVLVSNQALSLCVCVPITRGDAADILLQLAAAAAAVERCGGIQMADGGAPLHVYLALDGDRLLKHQVLLATLPLLRNIIGHLPLPDMHITRRLLQSISSQLPHCSGVSFPKDCTFEQGIWGVMVSFLPHVTEIRVSVEAATLHQLMVLCATATHPITIILQDCELPAPYDDDEGDEEEHEWVEVLQQAVVDAGHNYVTIDCELDNV